jgi:hypothetical protein
MYSMYLLLLLVLVVRMCSKGALLCLLLGYTETSENKSLSLGPDYRLRFIILILEYIPRRCITSTSSSYY